MTNEAAYRGYLNEVHKALNNGEASDGERLAKAVSALVRAERDVAEYLQEMTSAADYDDPDAIRAELQRRFARFVDAERVGEVPEVFAGQAADVAEG